MAQRPRGRCALPTHRWEQVSVAKSPWGKDGETPPPSAEIHSEHRETHSPVSEMAWVRDSRDTVTCLFSSSGPRRGPERVALMPRLGSLLPASPQRDQGSPGKAVHRGAATARVSDDPGTS